MPKQKADGDKSTTATKAPARPTETDLFGRFQFPDWFGRFPEMFSSRFPDLWSMAPTADMLRVEEFRDGDDLVVRAEIPGVDPENDIEITVDKDRLVIKAQRTQRSETREKDAYRSEFRYGSFQRVLSLPAGASEDDVSASYTDGILEVRVPVDKAKAKSVKVPIARR